MQAPKYAKPGQEAVEIEVKLELKDINGNEYTIEKSIIIVDKDANYEMYHTLNDEYNTYLEAKRDRNLIYLN